MKSEKYYLAGLTMFCLIMAAISIFSPPPPDLHNGDIVTIDGETYIVEQSTSYGKVVLIGPGPGSNPDYDTKIVNVALHRPTQIIKKDDPGWETNAAWFFLQ